MYNRGLRLSNVSAPEWTLLGSDARIDVITTSVDKIPD